MNFEMNDDAMSDRIDYLADTHQDFFEWLDILWTVPEDVPDWEFYCVPPSDEELEWMNHAADSILDDLL